LREVGEVPGKIPGKAEQSELKGHPEGGGQLKGQQSERYREHQGGWKIDADGHGATEGTRHDGIGWKGAVVGEIYVEEVGGFVGVAVME
jgi:hypothetical protein